eukprot:m.206852 g.206852  ORF g.206852 m.206852 type:complete len:1421 (+) comp17114_c0_seq1:183-4445(+)
MRTQLQFLRISMVLSALTSLILLPTGYGDCTTQESQVCTASSITVKEDNINNYSPMNAVMIAPTARAYHASTVASHPLTNTTYMLVFGGCQDPVTAQTFGIALNGSLNDLWIYDLVRRVWFEVTFLSSDVLPLPRHAHACTHTCSRHAMLCFGGILPKQDLAQSCETGVALPINVTEADRTLSNETWLLTGSVIGRPRAWRMLSSASNSSMPPGRAGHALVTAQVGIVLFAGLTQSPGGTGSVLNDVWLANCDGINNNNVTWTAIVPSGTPPPPRHSHTAVVLAVAASLFDSSAAGQVEAMLVFGGTNATALPVDQATHFFNDLWALRLDPTSPGTAVWVLLSPLETSPLPLGRHSHAALTSRTETLVVYGGASGDGDHRRDVWTFDPTSSVWTELVAWFTPGNESKYGDVVRATALDLGHRDRWGHQLVAVEDKLELAEAYLAFGGFNSEQYFAQTTDRLTAFVHGLLPSEANLMLWQDALATAPPFPRIEHTAVKYGRPTMTPYPDDPACQCLEQAWTWKGSSYFGCARPLGAQDYICPVAKSCDASSCWPLRNTPDSNLHFTFCSEDALVLLGGIYNGDRDHTAVADTGGVVWLYNVQAGNWRMEELLRQENAPVPGPVYQHGMVRLPPYRLGEPLPEAKPSTPVHREHFLVFAGQQASPRNRTMYNWLYRYTPAIQGYTGNWTRLLPSFDASMQGAKLTRAGHAAESYSYLGDDGKVEADMYVFGGYFMQAWANRQSVSGNSLFLKYSARHNLWSSLPVPTTGPGPRFFSSLVQLDLPFPMLILFGGESAPTRRNTQLYGDTWVYDLQKAAWSQLSTANAPAPRESHIAVGYGSKMLVYGGKRAIDGKVNTDNTCSQSALQCSYCDLWELDMGHSTQDSLEAYWTLLAGGEDCDGFPHLRHGAGIVSRGTMVVYGGYQGRLGAASDQVWMTRPGCIIGAQSNSYYSRPCELCPKGSYAPDAGHHCCLPCETYRYTSSNGSISPTNCSRCVPDFCHHGTCSVDGGSIKCDCPFGFTTVDNCAQPWWIIGPVVIVFILLLLIWLRRRYRRWQRSKFLRRIQLMQTKREVEEMSRGWEIQEQDLEFGERIDINSRGACSEVFQAKWHNIQVAVKKLNPVLLLLDADGYTADFDREVRMLRSMRHPHVVLFFGAGRLRDGTPFLVTEYCSLGSVAEYIHDPRNELDLNLKLRFALDAAKGMRFLHYCSPPRIHRDLKPGNLLVSSSMSVKVADLGTSRLLRDAMEESNPPPTPPRRQSWSRRKRPPKRQGSERDPLLPSARDSSIQEMEATTDSPQAYLTRNLGTPVYQAPEIQSDQPYSIKADVYSYGICFFEIYTRTIPFEALAKSSVFHLRQAVLRGERPTIPEDCPSGLARIMQDCWTAEPYDRPSFDAIVQRLTAISDGIAIVAESDPRGENWTV